MQYGAFFHSEWQKDCEASKSTTMLMMMMTMMARWRVRFSNQNDNGFPKLAANSLLALNPALPFFQQRTNWHSTATLNFVPFLIFCSSLLFADIIRSVLISTERSLCFVTPPPIQIKLHSAERSFQTIVFDCLIFQSAVLFGGYQMWFIALWGTCTTLWGLCSKVDKVENHNDYVCRGVRVW